MTTLGLSTATTARTVDADDAGRFDGADLVAVGLSARFAIYVAFPTGSRAEIAVGVTQGAGQGRNKSSSRRVERE